MQEGEEEVMAVGGKQELIPGTLLWFCVSSFSELGER